MLVTKLVTAYNDSLRIVKRKTLSDFWAKHPQSAQPLRTWFHDAKRARWAGPAEVKARYKNASIIEGNRIVFNIGGNDFRLVVKVHYNTGIMFIRFVGTHAQYDRIDARTV